MKRSVLILLLLGLPAAAQTCFTVQELEPGVRSALERSVQQYVDMVQAGDVFNLKQRAIGGLAQGFSSVEALVIEAKPDIAGASAQTQGLYMLETGGSSPQPRAEFFCGVFNSPNRVGFAIPNLPPGRYAIAIEEFSGGKEPHVLTLILQQQGSEWKLGGFYLKPRLAAGHDSAWFLAQAREYKTRGQLHNAWLYYLTAWELEAPVSFMSTPKLDRLADEMQQVRPSDLPSPNSPLNLPASNGQVYRITYLAPVPVKGELHLLVRYQSSDVSNTAQAFADNMAVMKALVTRYPEYRQGFAGVVARATESSGRDYGTPLAMKDVK